MLDALVEYHGENQLHLENLIIREWEKMERKKNNVL